MIRIDDEDYEIINDEARMLTVHIVDLFHRLGIPSDLTVHDMNEVSWAFISRIVQLWKRFFPEEYRDWVAGMEYELKYERPVRQAIKGGGYTPISYPARVYNLIHVFLPDLKMQDREFAKKFVKLVPEFKNTNYRI